VQVLVTLMMLLLDSRMSPQQMSSEINDPVILIDFVQCRLYDWHHENCYKIHLHSYE